MVSMRFCFRSFACNVGTRHSKADTQPSGSVDDACVSWGQFYAVLRVLVARKKKQPTNPQKFGHLPIEIPFFTRRWFQRFFIFTPKIGEDEPILTHIFQMGWFNHQLV